MQPSRSLCSCLSFIVSLERGLKDRHVFFGSSLVPVVKIIQFALANSLYYGKPHRS